MMGTMNLTMDVMNAIINVSRSVQNAKKDFAALASKGGLW